METTIGLGFRVVMGVELVGCSRTRTTEFLLLQVSAPLPSDSSSAALSMEF